MATHTPLSSDVPLLDATVSRDASTPVAGDGDPHWHMPADGCDHRTYACSRCCPHGDDAD